MVEKYSFRTSRAVRLLRRPGSGLILAVASFGNALFPMVRGICVARLLTPAEFGLAVTITLVSGIAELVTDIGVTQMAIKSGGAGSLDTLHSIAVIRGALLGGLIALCGPLLALVFHSPNTAWIYTVVGAASFIRSFMHLDIKVQMRGYSYLPDAIAAIGSQLVWTAVTIGTAMVLHDFRAMAFGLIAYSIAYVGLTHSVTSIPWRLGWRKDVVAESIRYGRPLMMNGIVYSLMSLGDRTLAGAKISLDQLARYTALTTSAFLPRSVISGFLNSLFIAHFVNATTEVEQRRVGDLWFLIVSLLAGTFGFGYLALGKIFTAVVFGKAYNIDQSIVSLVGILGSIRYLACLPSPPALASGKNALLLKFTIMSTMGLAMGGALLAYQSSLEYLVFGMSIGETIALIWVVHRLSKLSTATPVVIWWSVVAPLGMLAVIASILYLQPNMGLPLQCALCASAAAVHVAGCVSLLGPSGSAPKDILRMLFPARIPSDSRPVSKQPASSMST